MTRMSSAHVEFRRRRYKAEKQPLEGIATVAHPLRGITMVDGKAKKKLSSSSSSKTGSRPESPSRAITSTPLDPLSAAITASMTSAAGLDPLSAMAREDARENGATGKPPSESTISNDTEPWSARRCEILARFTTSEKLSIVSSFLDQGSLRRPAEVSVRERVQSRLEQLDDFEEGSVLETANLTQQEYVTKIAELSRLLKKFWTGGERVRALKIAIQCAKLLNDVTVVRFYPSKFVLVTDLLEDFGTLVFERLMDKAVHQSPGKRVSTLPANFRPSQVPEAAKETTRNWFYKIASIRELLPRIYVEAALLKNYRYLDPLDITRAVRRLCHQARGIADPLVGIYLRAFVARMGVSAMSGGLASAKLQAQLNSDREALMRLAFDDTLSLLRQIERPVCQRTMSGQGVDLPTYLTLYTPALDWLLHCLLTSGDEAATCAAVLERCEADGPFQTLLLHSLLSSLPPAFIGQQAARVAAQIARAAADGETGYPRHLLYQQFGACMVLSPPADAAVRLQVLQEVWKLVRQLSRPREYVLCADTWVEFVARHFGRKDVGALLGDIVAHVTPDRSFEELYGQLQSILAKLLANVKSSADVHALFGSERFLQFVDLFQRDYTRVQACTAIFELFNRTSADGLSDSVGLDDPVVVNTLLYLGRLMHDSLDVLNCSDGDQRTASALLKGFISRVDFVSSPGGDAERQLAFFVDCRAAFPGLEPVQVHLSLAVNALAMRCLAERRGVHTGKSGAFVRACVAFAFITIPSLTGVAARVRLYAHTALVALANACHAQADACFKSGIALLRELKNGGAAWETELVELTALLAGGLLTAPDNPAHGCLYLVKGLLNAVTDAAAMNVALRTLAFLAVLPLLAALLQPRFLYHAAAGPARRDANDDLYGQDPLFTAEVHKVLQTVLFEAVAGLPACPVAVSFRLLNILIRTARLADAETRRFIGALWSKAEGRAANESSHEAGRLRRAAVAFLKSTAAGLGDEEAEGAALMLNDLAVK